MSATIDIWKTDESSAIFKSCLIAQASVRGTQTYSPRLSSISLPVKSRIARPHQKKKARTLPPLPWGDSAAKRAAKRERRNLHQKDAVKSRVVPPPRAGREMTAEIAIMNKTGVALAADSKVTIGYGNNIKTFDTVNKLFTLSKVHPIGIMIWGNAEFMGYPWETIIKEYRASKGARSEPTVKRWATSFISFFKDFVDLNDDAIGENAYSILESYLDDFKDDVMRDARQKKIPLSSEEFTNLLEASLRKKIDNLAARQTIIPKRSTTALLKKYGKIILAAIREVFPSSKSNRKLSNLLQKLSLHIFEKDVFSPRASGFVVAGYGNKEMFPALVQFETDGYVGRTLKITDGKSASISRQFTAAIIPFAQKEMVQRFMNGVDPNYTIATLTLFGQAMVDNCLEVLEKYGRKDKNTKKIRESISNATFKSVQNSAKNLSKFGKKAFSDPICQMVSLLPKDELPHLAESLVALRVRLETLVDV